MGPGGGDELSLIGKPMRDVAGQISGIAHLLDLPLHDGGGHPLAPRSGHTWNDFVEKEKAWALELERGRMDEQRKKKASHTTINAKILRMKFGARSWKSRP